MKQIKSLEIRTKTIHAWKFNLKNNQDYSVTNDSYSFTKYKPVIIYLLTYVDFIITFKLPLTVPGVSQPGLLTCQGLDMPLGVPNVFQQSPQLKQDLFCVFNDDYFRVLEVHGRGFHSWGIYPHSVEVVFVSM